jgi:hypothetical protein
LIQEASIYQHALRGIGMLLLCASVGGRIRLYQTWRKKVDGRPPIQRVAAIVDQEVQVN